MPYDYGTVLSISVVTHSPSTGAVQDADSAPTYEIFRENNDVPIASGNLAKRDSKTGHYWAGIVLSEENSFFVGGTYEAIVTAVVNGVTAKNKVLDFQVEHHLKNVDSGATTLFRDGGGGKTADDLSSAIATVDGNVDAILVDTGTTLPASIAGLSSAIATVDGNVDAILVDTGTTLPASIAGITGALNGEGSYTGTLTVDDGEGNGLEGAVVHARRGGVLKASGTTNADGEITGWVFGAYTYDLAVRLAGYQPDTDTITVSGDAWTKTVSLTAISITAPDAASLCTVQFRVKLADTAVSGAVCKAKLIGVNQASDGVILSNAESSDTTDSEGVAELQLVQKGSVVKGNGIHKIWVEIAGNPVASVETAIPNQSTILFEDLLC
jgi:hypothetical protein